MSKFNVDLVKEIEKIAKNNGGEYIDAIIHYSEANNIDIETVAAVVKRDAVLRSKIQIEAENLRFLKNRSARLPIE